MPYNYDNYDTIPVLKSRLGLASKSKDRRVSVVKFSPNSQKSPAFVL